MNIDMMAPEPFLAGLTPTRGSSARQGRCDHPNARRHAMRPDTGRAVAPRLQPACMGAAPSLLPFSDLKT